MSVFAGDKMELIRQSLVIEGATNVEFTTVPGAVYDEARVVVHRKYLDHVLALIHVSRWLDIVDCDCDETGLFTIVTHYDPSDREV